MGQAHSVNATMAAQRFGTLEFLMSPPVEIVSYDPNWPRLYASAEVALRAAIGSKVVTVDHVGSTAIPGMSAKPVIDIDITLCDLADVDEASARLIDAGYEPRGNRYGDEVWAFMMRTTTPNYRVYLCPPKNETHLRRLLFRDYLRHHTEAAEAYLVLKTKLALQYAHDGDLYTSEKRQFVADVVDKARALL